MTSVAAVMRKVAAGKALTKEDKAIAKRVAEEADRREAEMANEPANIKVVATLFLEGTKADVLRLQEGREDTIAALDNEATQLKVREVYDSEMMRCPRTVGKL